MMYTSPKFKLEKTSSSQNKYLQNMLSYSFMHVTQNKGHRKGIPWACAVADVQGLHVTLLKLIQKFVQPVYATANELARKSQRWHISLVFSVCTFLDFAYCCLSIIGRPFFQFFSLLSFFNRTSDFKKLLSTAFQHLGDCLRLQIELLSLRTHFPFPCLTIPSGCDMYVCISLCLAGHLGRQLPYTFNGCTCCCGEHSLIKFLVMGTGAALLTSLYSTPGCYVNPRATRRSLQRSMFPSLSYLDLNLHLQSMV